MFDKAPQTAGLPRLHNRDDAGGKPRRYSCDDAREYIAGFSDERAVPREPTIPGEPRFGGVDEADLSRWGAVHAPSCLERYFLPEFRTEERAHD